METNMELKKFRTHTYIHTIAMQLFESLKNELSILIFFKYFKIKKNPQSPFLERNWNQTSCWFYLIILGSRWHS